MLTENRPEGSPASNLVEVAAEKLVRHIRASGLKPGDRYMTAEQASQLLGKSVMTIQRAMALLARRNILERRPRAGTFIGESAVPASDMSCIHFFMPEQFGTENNVWRSFWDQIPDQMGGIQSVIPNVSVQFSFIPNQDVAFTQQMLEKIVASGMLKGVVLISPSRRMRAFFNESGIPTVVQGGVEADLTNLCWLQWDQTLTGRLLAGYLIGRGHRKIVTIMRDTWSIGEHLVHDGISEEISAAGLPATTLLIRSAPFEETAIRELGRSLLTSGDKSPTGFVCRSEFQAICLTEVIGELGLENKCEIAVCNGAGVKSPTRYACAVPELNPEQYGRVIGDMLKQLGEGKFPEPRGFDIPVTLKAVGA